MPETAAGLVEHLFRREAGKLVSGLARRLGAAQFDIAEEAVQDALVKALKTWPHVGTPPNAAAWLSRVAHNLALDRLRRRAAFAKIQSDLAGLARHAAEPTTDSEALDDQLAMMFGACHAALPAESRVALTLKAVCGFSTGEIARAFLADEAAIAQRLVRAKRLLREQDVSIAVPPPAELVDRLDSVLRAVYLLFNEGYAATEGEDLVRHDLCAEALRLGRLLTSRPDTGLPKAHALVALMFFHASRLPARVNGAGDLLRLADQDRGLWDWRLIHAGLRHIELASEGDELTTYHLEAGIAAIHAQAPSDDATDWRRILFLYDRLLELHDSPVVALNRAVAVAHVDGAEAGLAALRPLVATLSEYFLFHSVRSEFLRRLRRIDEARAAYGDALALPCSEPERRFLLMRLRELDPAG